MDHEAIVVTIIGSGRAAKQAGWQEDDLIWLAQEEDVLIDANDPTHAAAFGISPYYMPAAWVEEVKTRSSAARVTQRDTPEPNEPD